jgi:hypothetical protein
VTEQKQISDADRLHDLAAGIRDVIDAGSGLMETGLPTAAEVGHLKSAMLLAIADAVEMHLPARDEAHAARLAANVKDGMVAMAMHRVGL